jgi:sulfate permease, SulP family
VKSTVVRSLPQTESGPTLAEHAREFGAMGARWLESWRETIKSRSLPSDVLAGITVAAVALPLNLALAVACGMPPSAGLIAGALGGAIAVVFGGSPLQVTGPAAALSAMVLVIAGDFGVTGVAAAALMVGVIELALALALAGKVIRFVPESVLAGFTTGVGIKILDSQIPEVLGFDYKVFELAGMMHRPAWLHHVSWLATMCGVVVAFFVVSMQKYKRFPAAIAGIGVVTFIAVYLSWDIERVGAIPSSFPKPSLPLVPDEQWLDLAIKVAPLGLLAAVESLLSARAVDRMTQTKKPHDANLELVGQGLANVAVGFFSGMPVSGVIVRSGVNVQSGGKTRLASMVHAGALAVCVLFLSKYMALIPLAALAGLLCVVGFRLIELKTLAHLYGESKLEAIAFVAACAGTVSGHLMSGLVVGLAISFADQHFFKRSHADVDGHGAPRRVRAIVGARKDAIPPMRYQERPHHGSWLSNIRQHALVAKSAFVHPKSALIGKVVMGEHVHVAAGSSVRADEGSPFYFGDNTNLQDGVVVHALKDKHVLVAGEPWAVYVGTNVSIAHDALVHGPCYIGDRTFVGFKAVVHDSIVGADCFIGIGSVVVGVEVPDGRFVPHGTIVDSAEAVERLPLATEHHREFNEDVVEVNRGLAVAYRRHDAAHDAHDGVVPRKMPGRRAAALLKSTPERMRF